ncbi:MAG TPA: amino acid transporter [Bdellovibrionales bacterium]|nr:MAG: amino acid transporter [Bdellovibrionales bacterium GWB1_52_6]OFZ05512.1 MAG: amino acid transporter [Bdellovibrionales bacterium GWA1_52_35]OFZ42186.1 MAG: amino acid transporter [Bdellovibrionales bacterium GWC1_52_8]HAR44263.1 amino acid transporter [Bdellovibrionales bacterium]HCM39122.1 amino acid transporter [Bdellovibrionales bacterium]
MKNVFSFQQLFRKKSIAQIHADAAAGYIDEPGHSSLRKELTVVDLTAFGIAAIVGAGIFSTIGGAAFNGGPAVVFLFIFTAIACGFSALCYAEFASRIPVAGSAYTYAYASFGELIAWIIGWDLLMEYAIGNIAVAISWSDYFTGLVAGYGWHISDFLTMDFVTASKGYAKITELLASGMTMEQIQLNPDWTYTLNAYNAWVKAPLIGGFHFVCDLPAFVITVLTTGLIFFGIRESKRASNFLVALKILVILLIIVMGAFYVNPENWSPFAPNGVSGVLKGVSGVFFAYIGFDAISTTAEECQNPQRDLPRGMIASLVICTGLYILIALVLTGMMSYKKLNVGDPLAHVFGPAGVNLPWISGIVAVSAVAAMTTVLLVFQLGQPRIWMAMSRDGLLPRIFSSIHPKYKTPWFSTLLAGFAVAVPTQFLNLTEVTDLTSIGTLFAFALVSGGVLFLDRHDVRHDNRFHLPYINGQFLIPGILLAIFAGIWLISPETIQVFLNTGSAEKLPMWTFLIFAGVLAVLSFKRRLSAIPVLGLLSCTYLMTELGLTNWIRFGIWLLVGLALYFTYGVRKSRLRTNLAFADQR